MTKKLPWGMFYWSDYAGDPKLRLCSLAAQGLWMRMLCIAAEHDGYVAVNDEALDDEALASIVGKPVEQVSECVAELERRGVFSRDRRGVVFSRRMINDRKRRDKAKEWGRKGGNPTLRKQRENSGEDKGGVKADVKPRLIPHIPESRVHIVPIDKSIGPAADELPDEARPDFDPVKALFDTGIRVLGAAGNSDKTARSLIGRWRKEHGDDAVALALAAAESQHISQPLEWIPKWLASRKANTKPGASTGEDKFMDAMAADYLGKPKGE
jgi:hypothetical protein